MYIYIIYVFYIYIYIYIKSDYALVKTLFFPLLNFSCLDVFWRKFGEESPIMIKKSSK